MFFISYYNTKGTKGATNLAAGEIYTKNWLNCENVKTKIDITKFPILLLTLYIAESLKCFLFFFFLYYFLFIIIGKLESKAATSSSIFYVFAVTFYLFWMHFHYLIRLGGPSRCLPHCLSLCLYSARQSSEAKRKSRIQLKSFDSMRFSSAVDVVIETRDELEDLLLRFCCIILGELIFIME